MILKHKGSIPESGCEDGDELNRRRRWTSLPASNGEHCLYLSQQSYIDENSIEKG